MVHLQVNFSGDDKYPGVSGVFTREIHLTRWVPRAPPCSSLCLCFSSWRWCSCPTQIYWRPTPAGDLLPALCLKLLWSTTPLLHTYPARGTQVYGGCFDHAGLHAGARRHYGQRFCYRKRSALNIAFSWLMVMIWIQIPDIQKNDIAPEPTKIFPILLKLSHFNMSMCVSAAARWRS